MAVAKCGSVLGVLLVVCVCFGLCENTFFILNAPTYVQISSEAGAVHTHEVGDILALLLGFSPAKELQWTGLSSSNLFRRPKSSVVFNIEIDKHSNIKPEHLLSFPMVQESGGFVDTSHLKSSISSSYPTSIPLLVDSAIDGKTFTLVTQYPDLFGHLPSTLDTMLPVLHGKSSILYKHSSGSLNVTNSADLLFFSELQLLQGLLASLFMNRALVMDNIPDVYTFTLSGVRAVQHQYGLNSNQAKDVERILQEFLPQFSTGFMELYGNDAVITAVTTQRVPQFLHRHGRSILQSETSEPVKETDLNIANRSEDFPVFFNIILWLSVVLILFVVVVAYGMWYMDPGDTIIYRMTSQRIKMD